MTPPEVWAQRLPGTTANGPGWSLRIVPNKYPALSSREEAAAGSDGFYRSMGALGVHEVIVESPDHVTDIGALDAARLAAILRAYRGRLLALESDPRWRYLLIYKNQGESAGATLEHVHSQLTALPTVPPAAMDEIDGATRYFARTGRCIYCEICRLELAAGERLVSENDRIIALCPFAPRFAYETWLLPKTHGPKFSQSSEEDLRAFGEILRAVLLKLGRVAVNPAFNYVIHSSPQDDVTLASYHWHMEILPQLTRAAGFEWGSGVHMNSIAPEDAARTLRDMPI
jgi:UDPglucose--hexose-1-phosphate uridylyltransferase